MAMAPGGDEASNHHPDDDDDDNAGGTNRKVVHEHKCSSCGAVGVPFSSSQLNKAHMFGKAARCVECVEANNAVDAICESTVVNDDDDDDDATNNAAATANLSNEKEAVSKEERNRLKKERKAAKKTAKKAAKKENQQKDASTSSSSSSNSSSSSRSNQEIGLAQFSDPEMNAKCSDDEQVNHAHFSDTEMEAMEGNDGNQSKTASATATAAAEPQSVERHIPRKRKAPTDTTTTAGNKRQASLTANMKPANPKPSPPALMNHTCADDAEEEEFAGRDHDNEEEEEDDMGNVSISALKHKVLGRQVRTDDDVHSGDDEDDGKPAAQPYTTTERVSPELRSELSCAICHETYLQPVSLLCGHSFCQECVQWWWQSLESSTTNSNKNCPTCRRDIPMDNPTISLGINTALRACVMALLGHELQGRIQAARDAKRQATKGEHGGSHDRGYEVVAPVEDESWKKAGMAWPCRRSIVLDAEDQRMQLALGIWKDATTPGMVFNARAQSLQVSLCLLTMEEDEAADGGFPRVVDEDDDEDNEHLLVSRNGGRFFHSFVRATAKGEGDQTSFPLGRWGIRATGVVELSLDLSGLQGVSVITLEHEESGATLDLKAPSSLGGDGRAVGAMAPGAAARYQTGERSTATVLELGEGDDDEDEEEGRHFDSEDDDGSHLDHFENDGFIADEGHDGEHDEDDFCNVCNKHGDLMICDGGENVEGCGRSFHIHCVHREIVPPGDWICENCANDLGLDVGIEGHEFLPDVQSIHDSDSENGGQFSESEASPLVKRKHKRLKKPQPVIAIDSDSDESVVEPNSDGSAKSAQRHIGDDSEDEDADEHPAAGAAKKPTKRICVIDSDEDDDE